MAFLDLLFDKYSAGFFFQMCGIILIMIYDFGSRGRPYIRIPVTLAVGTAVGLLYPESEFLGWLKPFFLVAFLMSAAFVYFCFDVNIQQSLFWAMAAYVIQNFTFHIYTIVCVAMGYADYIDGGIYVIFNWLGSFLIAFLMRLFVVGKLKYEINVGLENRSFVGIVGIVVFVVFVLNSLLGVGETDSAAYIVMHVFAATCCLLTILVQFGSFARRYLRKRTEVMEQILRIEQEQHELSKENMDIINMKCHDLKHQINALRHAGNTGERDKMLDEIEQAVMIYDCVFKTGNDALDILLTEKSLYCGKYGIRLLCMADGEKLSFMASSDIYSLFGNALDNAIESLKNVEDADKRMVTLDIHAKGDLLIVHMENWFEGRLEFVNGLPQTTKGDKTYHGFGMQSMRYTVGKYGGELSVRAENNMFGLEIVIPVNADARDRAEKGPFAKS